jgi:hypothetical protein
MREYLITSLLFVKKDLCGESFVYFSFPSDLLFYLFPWFIKQVSEVITWR